MPFIPPFLFLITVRIFFKARLHVYFTVDIGVESSMESDASILLPLSSGF